MFGINFTEGQKRLLVNAVLGAATAAVASIGSLIASGGEIDVTKLTMPVIFGALFVALVVFLKTLKDGKFETAAGGKKKKHLVGI